MGERQKQWLRLVSLVLPVRLNGDKDNFIWLIKKNRVFSTHSLYREKTKKERLSGKECYGKQNYL